MDKKRTKEKLYELSLHKELDMAKDSFIFLSKSLFIQRYRAQQSVTLFQKESTAKGRVRDSL